MVDTLSKYIFKLIPRSQTVYGSLVETYGPYLHDYTSIDELLKSIAYSNLYTMKNQVQYKNGIVKLNGRCK
jgi:hypothetical protein